MPSGRPKTNPEKQSDLRKEVREKLWSPQEKPLGLPDVWLPNPPAKKGTSAYAAWAKECFFELIKAGYNLTQAADYLGYDGYKWVEGTKKRDPEWWEEVQKIRGGEYQEWEYPDLSGMSFAEFCEAYGGFTLAEHQEWIEQAVMDPLGKLVLILGHPESGKSTLISLWYVLYRIALDPDSRIALVSKSTEKARDLLRRIKRYLTEPHLYADTPRNLIEDFNGWQPIHGELEWSNDRIFVRHRKSGERDPTVQALGIGKQIYGVRLDYLILDDSLVLDNQISETQRQHLDNWFTAEARSRVQQGQTVICGTRLFPLDLYGQWQKALAEHPLFRQVIIPAIQNEWSDDEVPTWKDYWRLDGFDITETHDGEEIVVGYQQGLRDIRSEVMARNPDQWRLVYQQEDVQESSAIFRREHIDKALELGTGRARGQVFPHEMLVLGVDPATTGRAASVLLAIDPETRVRTVIDMFVGQRLGATGIRQKLFYQFWDRYKDHGISFTVVETNYAPTLLGDEAFMERARETGTHIKGFVTTARGRRRGAKWDEEYGIAAMAPLFGGGLMAFAAASPEDRQMTQPLIDDMLVFPYAEAAQDALIALWIANSEATTTPRKKIDQARVMRRRGVPPVIQRRRTR